MADPALLDAAAFDSLPQIDPALFDSHLFPDDFPIPPGLDLDDDLDLDLDLDLDFDFDFPIDDLIQPAPDDGSPVLLSPDGYPATTDPNQSSGVSSSSPMVSGNHASNLSDHTGPPSPESGHSASYSPNSGNHSSAASSVTEPDVKPEDERDPQGLKRKKGHDDGIPNPNLNPNSNLRAGKLRRSEDTNSPCVFNSGSGEEEKRRARLMRNRDSAQLSRQRKKHYVEELEAKMRSMHSTIAELNSKISYIMAENASLRQQLGGSPSPSASRLPAAPMAPVHFPWIPAYAYRPQGSHAPLVPIPRLKSQQPAPAPKPKPKPKAKRSESKTKKVASVSLLGLLFIALIFGAVFPGLNLRYGGSRDSETGGFGVVKDGLSGHSQGRILNVSGRTSSLNSTDEIGMCSGMAGLGVKHKPCPDVPVFTQNASETIPALLYVPRNGKHVKINGNLIIHSVLASEKAMAEKTLRDKAKQSSEKEGKETGLAIAGNMASALAISQARREVERHIKSYRSSAEHQRDAHGDTLKSTPPDGPLQQWFHEGSAGPILSSGMCKEVFQFEVSPSSANPGGIVPATLIVNATDGIPRKPGRPGKTRNRRILYPHPIPLPGSTPNATEYIGRGNFNGNASVSSMVVSVLADPREAGDGDGDVMMTPKSLSRIFVVVLLDSVKYVTYSCALPFKSSTSHLVN